MLRITSFLFILILVSGCKKNNDPVTIHCANLVNDILPADDKGRIEVASAFTPNGDGLNDSFRPHPINMKSISVKVYDDKSNLLFQTDQSNAEWHINEQIKRYERFYYRIEGVTLKDNKIGICGEVYALSCYPPGMEKRFSFEDMLTSLGFTGISMENLANCN